MYHFLLKGLIFTQSLRSLDTQRKPSIYKKDVFLCAPASSERRERAVNIQQKGFEI